MLEVRRVTGEVAVPLTAFFEELKANGTDRLFHPHPLTASEAERIAHYDGADCYYVLTDNNEILGYGMLRGWDEGFEVPSLGIVISERARGQKFGELFMHFLHAAARRRGARQIRLKVYATNAPAKRLYEQLGYKLSPCSDDELLGILDL